MVRQQDEDIISELPETVIETILTRLPLQDAIRTSILSKKWRYSWATIPKLVFDDEVYKQCSVNNLTSTILKVILLHKGPVLDFTLVTGEFGSFPVFDQSLLFLAKKGLKKYVYNISKEGVYYELVSSFFSFHHVTLFDLDNRVFKPPPTFKCFTRLTSLVFWEVEVVPEVLEGFLSNCPLLERLVILSSKIIRYKIFAPPKSNAPRIKYLASCYAFQEDLWNECSESGSFYFIELFDFLSVSIEQLTIDREFFKLLATGTIPKKLPTVLDHLEVLVLVDLSIRNRQEISLAMCLIGSSPNLKIMHFHLKMSYNGDAFYFPSQDYMDISLNKLVKVTIEPFTDMKSEVDFVEFFPVIRDFVKFLLAKSPVLEEMRLKPLPAKAMEESMKMLKELINFRRLSRRAGIFWPGLHLNL